MDEIGNVDRQNTCRSKLLISREKQTAFSGADRKYLKERLQPSEMRVAGTIPRLFCYLSLASLSDYRNGLSLFKDRAVS